MNILRQIFTAFLIATLSLSGLSLPAPVYGQTVSGTPIASQSTLNSAQVVGLGDSRMAAVYLDTNPGGRSYGNRSPLNVANALLDGRIVVGDSYGQSGDRTDQFFARLDAAIATGAKIFYFQGGVNNIAAVASSGPFTYVHAVTGETVTINTVAAVTFRDIQQMCDRARAAGMTVVLEQEVGAQGINTTEKLTALQDLRTYIADYARRTPNVFLHDATSIVMQSSGLLFKTGYAYDATHVNARGAYYWGKSLALVLDRLVPTAPSPLIRNAFEIPANGRRQLLANPIFLTTTGGTFNTSTATANTNSTATLALTSTTTIPIGAGVSGSGIPAGTTITAQPSGGGAGNYTMSNAATATATGVSVTVAPLLGTLPSGFTSQAVGQATANVSFVADPQGVGNDITIAANFQTVGSVIRVDQSLAGNGAGAWNANIQAGDLVEAVAKVEITDSPAGIGAAFLYFGANTGSGGSTFDSFALFGPGDANNSGPNEPVTFTLRTRPFRIPAAVGSFPFVTVSVRFTNSAVGTANLKIDQMALRRLP